MADILVCKSYRCKECGRTGQTYGYLVGDEFDIPSFDPCESCESADIDLLVSAPNIDRFSERFPYFDRGLGVMLTSKNHRQEVCTQKGVVPIDGDIDFSDDYGKLERKNAEEDKIVADQQDRVDNHPGYAEYRKLKDQGWKPKHTHREQNEPGVDPFNEE
tara:strand:- start:425 stop:904 length:480 start_codon:yes stop_codon:yes gene_type:complete